MTSKEEKLKEIYAALDEIGKGDLSHKNRYVESLQRRLLGETTPKESLSVTFTASTKPEVKIYGGVSEEKVEEEEPLFEVEKLSEEEVTKDLKGAIDEEKAPSFQHGLSKEPKPKEVKEEEISVEEKEVPEIQPKKAAEFDQMYVLKESKGEREKIEKEIKEKEPETKEEISEWLAYEKEPVDEELPQWKVIEEGYRYEDYVLYKVEKKGLFGKTKTTYIFSKEPIKNGTPSQIPPGHVIKVNRKGIPSLEKIK